MNSQKDDHCNHQKIIYLLQSWIFVTLNFYQRIEDVENVMVFAMFPNLTWLDARTRINIQICDFQHIFARLNQSKIIVI